MSGCNSFPSCGTPVNLDWVMAKLRQQMDNLCCIQRMVDELVLKNASNIERLDDMQRQVSALTLTVGQALDSVADLKGRTIVVEQDLRTTITRVTNLENSVDDLSDSVAGITARMAANEAKDATQDDEILALKVRVTAAELAAQNLNETVNTVIQRVGKTERDVTDLQIDSVAHGQQINNLNGRVAGAELDIDILEGAYNNLSPRVAATEIVANDAQRRVGLVEVRTGALESSDTTQNAMLGDHQLKIVKAAQDIDEIEIGQRVQDDRLDLLEASDTAQGAGITNLTVRVTTAENRITVIENNSDSVGNLGTRVSNLENANDDHETRITVLEAGGGSGGDVDALVPRIVALELSDAQQNGDIGAINIAQGVQDAKIATLEAQDVLHGQQFSTLSQGVTDLADVNQIQNGRLTSLENTDSLHNTRLTTVETRSQNNYNEIQNLLSQLERHNGTTFVNINLPIQVASSHKTSNGGEIIFGFGFDEINGQSGVFARVHGGGDSMAQVSWYGEQGHGFANVAVGDSRWQFLHQFPVQLNDSTFSAYDYCVRNITAPIDEAPVFSGYAGKIYYMNVGTSPSWVGISTRE